MKRAELAIFCFLAAALGTACSGSQSTTATSSAASTASTTGHATAGPSASGSTSSSSGSGSTTSGPTSGSSTSGHATSGPSTTGAASHGASTAGASSGHSTTGGAGGTTVGSSSGTSSGSPPPGGFAGVLQFGNDLARDSVFYDPAFTASTVRNVSPAQDNSFNSVQWNGPVFASPLYFVDQALGKDLVIVVTESNEVYALDASDGSTVWSIPKLVTPIANPGSHMACGGLIAPMGITSTPVIDPATNTVYLSALDAVDAGSGSHATITPEHQIFALDLDTGATRAGWPIHTNTISTVLTDGTTLNFDSRAQFQRSALTLVNGTLYVGYGGIWGDCGDYHGWVVAVDTASPTNLTAYATDVHQAGIWGPSGPASDGTNLFLATGNGDESQEDGGAAHWLGGEAVLKLGPGATFDPTSTNNYFFPQDYVGLDRGDVDVGSTAPVLFDFNDTGGVRHLAFEIGKTQKAILLDQTALGGAEGELSAPSVSSNQVFGSLAAYKTPQATYVLFGNSYSGNCPDGGGGDTTALMVTPSHGSTPIGTTVAWCGNLGGGQAQIISMTPDGGGTDAVVWGGLNGGNLVALDGNTGVQIGSASIPGSVEHWTIPIIAKGRIFVVGDNAAWAFTP